MSATSASVAMQRPTVDVLGPEKDNHQRFTLGPLEPGFGYTLGSSLRRTLLSSIPGAAITQVHFDKALHEFATIEGVVEDITDLVLNFKDVVLRCVSDTPVAVRLDAEGPGVITAGDLDWGSDIECLTPDLHLATLSDGAQLAVDLTVERGWGYLSSADVTTSGEIGLIPVDAIFSPVRRVAVEVEPTRVEQSTNYDMLVIDIQTDGALSPREALSSAGDTLCSLFTLMSSMVEDDLGLGMTDHSAREYDSPDLDLPIEDLGLGERLRNSLKRTSIDTIGQLLENNVDELMAIPNFGQKSLEELIERLDELGFVLDGAPLSAGSDAQDADGHMDAAGHMDADGEAEELIGEANSSAHDLPNLIGADENQGEGEDAKTA